MMPWHFEQRGIEPRGFDGWDQHLGAAGIAGMVLMIILWTAIIAALVVGIRALILYSRGTGARSLTEASPAYAAGPTTRTDAAGPVAVRDQSLLLTVLEERYARGEIDREDFLKRKEDLGLS